MATSHRDQQRSAALHVSPPIPSYARPTAASDGRKALRIRSKPTARPVQSEGLKQQSPPAPSTPRRRHNARQPTPSSPPRTGFFDLPAELRNTIYELIYTARLHRRLDFHSGRCKTHPTHIIPAFLRADKRLFQEAASYYFSDGRFEILLAQGSTAAFFRWFAAIGPINQARLARNTNVTIRFVHAVSSCRNSGEHPPPWFMSACSLMIATASEAERRGEKVRLAQTKFPAVGIWNLAPTCEAVVDACKNISFVRRWTCEAHPVKLSNVALRTEMRGLVERVYEVLGSAAAKDEDGGFRRQGGARKGKRGVKQAVVKKE